MLLVTFCFDIPVVKRTLHDEVLVTRALADILDLNTRLERKGMCDFSVKNFLCDFIVVWLCQVSCILSLFKFKTTLLGQFRLFHFPF